MFVYLTSPPTLPTPPFCSGDINMEERQRLKSASRPSKDSEADSGVGVSATEKRFAYSLLEKLLEYFDKASISMTQTRPSTRFSRRGSYSTATKDVKFFGKVTIGLCNYNFCSSLLLMFKLCECFTFF